MAIDLSKESTQNITSRAYQLRTAQVVDIDMPSLSTFGCHITVCDDLASTKRMSCGDGYLACRDLGFMVYTHAARQRYLRRSPSWIAESTTHRQSYLIVDGKSRHAEDTR